MKFNALQIDGGTKARAGEITTSRGVIRTPVFMPVATRGAIRALPFRDIDEIGFEIILSNTYHLYIRPGTAILEKFGGLHNFMNFHKPVLTDSGGFQVFSLSSLCKIFDHGVEFKSHLDGSRHFFSPELVLDIQGSIGSDIMMVLDHCAAYPSSYEEAKQAVERTVNWADFSFNHWNNRFDHEKQALFAIVQGSIYGDLRSRCAMQLTEKDFSGFAIGGLSVGEPKSLYREMTDITLEHLPADKPRYMMGVGSPVEILYAVMQGVDMFDCVMPTRIARNGTLYTSTGRINIKSAKYEDDHRPLDEGCGCYVCRNFSRAYLRHIFRMGEISSLIYNTHHNLFFMKDFMDEIRRSICDGKFIDMYRRWASLYDMGAGKE